MSLNHKDNRIFQVEKTHHHQLISNTFPERKVSYIYYICQSEIRFFTGTLRNIYMNVYIHIYSLILSLLDLTPTVEARWQTDNQPDLSGYVRRELLISTIIMPNPD